MKIGILLIATGNYKSFIQQLLNGVEEHFLTNHYKQVYLYTDEIGKYETNISLIQRIIPSYKWPDATMLRYEIFTSMGAYPTDYLFYLDADMSIVSKIPEDILGELTAVIHPGYFKNKDSKGSWEERAASACFTPTELRKIYFAGGFSGGKSTTYFNAMATMKYWIAEDIKNGRIPRFHDESAWNLYAAVMNEARKLTVLNPSYCLPESEIKRTNWNLTEFEPKILALEKDFKTVRA